VRSIAFGLLLLLLAGCANDGPLSLRSGLPGIEVAQAALRGGSPQIALQIAGNILAREPSNEAALVVQGESLTALGRLDEATTSFESVMQRDPSSIAAHIGLGRVRLGSDPAGAEVLFLEALKREPRNAVALNDLGIARDLQGRHADAQKAYREAMAANSNMSAARVNLALSLAMDGQARDAVQLLRPLASDPGASRQLRHDLAAVLAMGGDRAEAERILSKDLPPREVQQALEAYASARPATAASLLTPGDTQAATPVRAEASGGGREGNVQVQLAAAASEDTAHAQWRRLQEQMPEVLGGRQPIIAKVERGGRVFWRLRAGGFADAGQATAFCERVRAGGTSCVMVQ
jgi:Flp pilus assembly protein TadD